MNLEGYEYGQPHKQGENDRKAQSYKGEGEITDSPDNDDLPDLAPDIVGDLLVHLIPDYFCQAPFPRQEILDPRKDHCLVFQEKEDEERHEDQVYED